MIEHHKCREKEMHTEFWWETIMERVHMVLKYVLGSNYEIGCMRMSCGDAGPHFFIPLYLLLPP